VITILASVICPDLFIFCLSSKTSSLIWKSGSSSIAVNGLKPSKETIDNAISSNYSSSASFSSVTLPGDGSVRFSTSI